MIYHLRMENAVSDSCVTQIIDGNGEFNAAGLDIFAENVNLASCAVSYTVVSIIGPQNSGKSTLLNHLFHTNFTELIGKRRIQTTKGVWIAKCHGIEPCMIALDLEGNDSRERGQDDTAFEKQIALFAFAISDIMIINMWYHDIGRESAANKPLLRTVFQIMMQLFSPGRKKTLLFVIRDKSNISVEELEPILLEDIHKIWDDVTKPPAHRSTQFNEIFTVHVIALSNYERDEDIFKDEVAQLRQSLSMPMSQGGFAAGDRKDVVPGSAFSLSSQEIWKLIKMNKDLNLPSHQVMVAKIRCEEIANEKFNQLITNKDWDELITALKLGPVKGSGERLSSLLDTCLSEYDMEAWYFDKAVRNAKGDELKKKASDVYVPVYITMLGNLHSTAFGNFKAKLEQLLAKGEEFASSVRTCTNSFVLEIGQGREECAMHNMNWDTSSFAPSLADINAHALSVRERKLLEVQINYEREYFKDLTVSVQAELEEGGKGTWVFIREFLKRETEVALSKLSAELVGFELDDQTIANMRQNLRDYARNLVVEEARRQVRDHLKLLKDMNHRFTYIFQKRNRDIKTCVHEARSNSLQLLSVKACICLDEKQNNTEEVLFSSLMGTNGVPTDLLISNTWSEVSSEDTLITPLQCKKLWRKFVEETEVLIKEAELELARKRRNNILTIAGVVILSTKVAAGICLLSWGNPLGVPLLGMPYR